MADQRASARANWTRHAVSSVRAQETSVQKEVAAMSTFEADYVTLMRLETGEITNGTRKARAFCKVAGGVPVSLHPVLFQNKINHRAPQRCPASGNANPAARRSGDANAATLLDTRAWLGTYTGFSTGRQELLDGARARSGLLESDGAGAQTSPRYQPHRGSRKAETWSRPTLHPSLHQTRNLQMAKRRDPCRGCA